MAEKKIITLGNLENYTTYMMDYVGNHFISSDSNHTTYYYFTFVNGMSIGGGSSSRSEWTFVNNVTASDISSGDLVIGKDNSNLIIISDTSIRTGLDLIPYSDTYLGSSTNAFKNLYLTSGSNNVALLDNSGKLNSSILPAIAVSETFTASSQSAMLALTAQVGDVCVRTDETKTYILVNTPASTIGNWKLLEHPADAVSSVNGKTGVVSLTASDVGALPNTTTVPTKTSDLTNDSGFTSNTGTVTSVSAGTGLSISGTASTTPTVNIADGYKLPTTNEWNAVTSNTVTSINGLSGGTLTSPITFTGGDGASASKIIMSRTGAGQITDDSTSTLFGWTSANASTLTVGSNSYGINLRGSGTRPKYKDSDLALYSDIPTSVAKTNVSNTFSASQTISGDMIANYVKIASIGHETTSSYNKHLTLSSTNYVRYRTTAELKSDLGVPTATSNLTNDSGFITSSYHDSTKQDALVSGTNIKTINGESILGSGDLTISGGGSVEVIDNSPTLNISTEVGGRFNLPTTKTYTVGTVGGDSLTVKMPHAIDVVSTLVNSGNLKSTLGLTNVSVTSRTKENGYFAVSFKVNSLYLLIPNPGGAKFCVSTSQNIYSFASAYIVVPKNPSSGTAEIDLYYKTSSATTYTAVNLTGQGGSISTTATGKTMYCYNCNVVQLGKALDSLSL